MENVLKVAKYLLLKSTPKTERAVTHLKLQKLVYYCQAWHLAIHGDVLFDEDIEAWVHGPVCPVLYYEYRDRGYSEISVPSEQVHLGGTAREIVDAVWETYGSFSGRYLEQLTHQEAPWLTARESLSGSDRSNNIITTDSMKVYYKGLLRGN